MKKTLALLLALLMVLSLAACGGDKQAAADPTPAAQPTDAQPAPDAPDDAQATQEAQPLEPDDELQLPLTPTDADYTGTRDTDDPNVGYGLWKGTLTRYTLPEKDDVSQGTDQQDWPVIAKAAYDADGQAYFEVRRTDTDEVTLFYYVEPNSGYDGICTDYMSIDFDKGDCHIMGTPLNEDNYYGLTGVVNNGEMILRKTDYETPDGVIYAFFFELKKDLSATLD